MYNSSGEWVNCVIKYSLFFTCSFHAKILRLSIGSYKLPYYSVLSTRPKQIGFLLYCNILGSVYVRMCLIRINSFASTPG